MRSYLQYRAAAVVSSLYTSRGTAEMLARRALANAQPKVAPLPRARPFLFASSTTVHYRLEEIYGTFARNGRLGEVDEEQDRANYRW